MSGGVDSSVAAYLTQKNGFEATGITLKLFDNEDIGEKREKTCCSLDDIIQLLASHFMVKQAKEATRLTYAIELHVNRLRICHPLQITFSRIESS